MAFQALMGCSILVERIRAETKTRMIGIEVEPDGAAQTGSLINALLAGGVAHHAFL